jgi:predicted anti-sigma-YlaC factor YlaD
VDCSTCREALSARLDGEAGPVPATETDAHLAQCTSCSRWQLRAQALTRRIRVRPAEPAPDLVEAALAAAPPHHTALTPRLGLAAVALLQLWLALAQSFAGVTSHAGHGGGGISGHLFNEGAAWNLALGIGLLVAAVDGHRAAGLLPTLGGFVVVLLAFSVHDLLDGTATTARVVSHLPLVAGLALLLLVAGAHRDQPVPGTPATSGHGDPNGTPDRGVPGPRSSRSRGRARHLRPTAHQRAA